MAKRLIIGMSGASGASLAVELLKQLKENHSEIETHFIITKSAEYTLKSETGMTLEELKKLVKFYHCNENIGAVVASGSFRTMGMIVIPCSMKTVAGIVSGYSDNLLLRAADVVLKERRKLVLVAREAPLSTLHLRNLYEASRLGAVVFPPMLTYYHQPISLAECMKQIVQRILAQFDLDTACIEWQGLEDE